MDISMKVYGFVDHGNVTEAYGGVLNDRFLAG